MYKDLSLQQIFTKVKNHLLTQNKKARTYNGCCYRLELTNNKVLMCAGGCLIPDDVYCEEMEGKYVDALPYFKENFTKKQLDFLRRLQTIHDNVDVEDWEISLRGLAVSCKLQYDETEATEETRGN